MSLKLRLVVTCLSFKMLGRSKQKNYKFKANVSNLISPSIKI